MLRDNALGNFRDILRRHREGHRDARLARRPHEHEGEAAGELRPRDHGAVHVGVGHYTEPDVYAARARVHRLEPAAARAPRPTDRSTTSSSTTPTSTRRPRRRSAFRSTPTAARPFPARAAADGMQDGIDLDRRARRAPEHGRATWRRSSTASSSASSATSIAAFVDRIAAVYLQSGYDMKAVMREVLLSPRVLGPRRVLRALLVAGGIRRPRAEGRRLDRLLGRRRADAAVEHGADAVRAAGRRRLGSRRSRGSRPARCWRG